VSIAISRVDRLGDGRHVKSMPLGLTERQIGRVQADVIRSPTMRPGYVSL